MLRSIRAGSVSRPLTWLRLCLGSFAYFVTGTRAPTCDGKSAPARAERSGGLSVTLKAMCEVVVGQLWDRMFAKKAVPAGVEMRGTVDNPIPHPQARVVISARPVQGIVRQAAGFNESLVSCGDFYIASLLDRNGAVLLQLLEFGP